MYKGEERREETEVHDRPAETGIKINNIISALILGVMAWVGVNIEVMKKDLGSMSTSVQLNAAGIHDIRGDVSELKVNVYANSKEIHRLIEGKK